MVVVVKMPSKQQFDMLRALPIQYREVYNSNRDVIMNRNKVRTLGSLFTLGYAKLDNPNLGEWALIVITDEGEKAKALAAVKYKKS